MDYADGGDLGDYLKKQRERKRLVPEKTAFDWFVQISLVSTAVVRVVRTKVMVLKFCCYCCDFQKAIKHIHDRKILHRGPYIMLLGYLFNHV
jgi:serine/threonine protein kinase